LLAALHLNSPHGRVAVVDATGLDDSSLDPGERALADAASPHRRRELVAGRAAIRALLPDAGAIRRDDRGAPVLPAGWVGSISHKQTHAAAIVAPDTGARIGVDLERAAPPRVDIAYRVLTQRELAGLSLAGDALGRAVTLRFAIKEAIYKAVDPFVRRYVGFHEVELAVADDGSCAVSSALPFTLTAWWCEVEGFWLATASASAA
jgi:4'-phosphopantetheinyl transferase EntD